MEWIKAAHVLSLYSIIFSHELRRRTREADSLILREIISLITL